MDFRTIEENLAAGRYASEIQFAEDVRLVFENAKTYNKVNSEVSLVPLKHVAHFIDWI